MASRFSRSLSGRPRPAAQPLSDDEARALVGSLHHEFPCYLKLQSKKGGDPSEWPTDLRVREFPA